MNIKDDLVGLKEKLMSLEKEFEGKLKDVEEKEEKFKIMDNRLEEYLKDKDSVLVLNIGGKKYHTKISTLMNTKDTLFYNIITNYIGKGEEVPKELFFDRSYMYFPLILDYLRTKKISLKGFSKYEKEDLLDELEYYGLADILKLSKKNSYDLEWDQNLSKAGMCTINVNDRRNIRVHSTNCYTHFVTNRLFTNENFVVELESTVTQIDNYYYIGIINENYNTTNNCMCCNPSNAYYIQCDGSIHINSARHDDGRLAWRSNSVNIGMKVMLKERQIYFYTPDKAEVGPFTIANGSNFRVVAGHCNNGYGEITIAECYEID